MSESARFGVSMTALFCGDLWLLFALRETTAVAKLTATATAGRSAAAAVVGWPATVEGWPVAAVAVALAMAAAAAAAAVT